MSHLMRKMRSCSLGQMAIVFLSTGFFCSTGLAFTGVNIAVLGGYLNCYSGFCSFTATDNTVSAIFTNGQPTTLNTSDGVGQMTVSYNLSQNTITTTLTNSGRTITASSYQWDSSYRFISLYRKNTPEGSSGASDSYTETKTFYSSGKINTDNITRVHYDPHTLFGVSSVTSTDQLTYSYNSQNYPVQVSEVINNTLDNTPKTITSTYSYPNSSTQVITTTDSTDSSHAMTTTNTFNTSGNITNAAISVPDDRGILLHTNTAYQYDSTGQNLLQATLTDAFGNTTTKVFDGKGWLQSITDSVGNVTRYSYHGNQIQSVSLTYAKSGNVVGIYSATFSSTDPDAPPTSVRTADPSGNQQSYTLNADGSSSIVGTDYQGRQNTLQYNQYGAPISYQGPSGLHISATTSGATVSKSSKSTKYNFQP